MLILKRADSWIKMNFEDNQMFSEPACLLFSKIISHSHFEFRSAPGRVNARRVHRAVHREGCTCLELAESLLKGCRELSESFTRALREPAESLPRAYQKPTESPQECRYDDLAVLISPFKVNKFRLNYSIVALQYLILKVKRLEFSP